MEITAYAIEAQIEATHWWFVGRRHLFSREIARLSLPNDAPILDIGTSTGTNLRMLRDLGFRQVTGLDSSDEAIRFCAEKQLGTVHRGDVCALPFEREEFNLVLATDLLEHVSEENLALREIARVLKPGGCALITVPAFQSLWGLQDELAHHLRRYRLPHIKDLVEAVGLNCVRCFYFNYLLFVPIWAARRVLRAVNVKVPSEGQLNTVLLNQLLSLIFEFDVRTARWLKPPFGVSALLLAEKVG